MFLISTTSLAISKARRAYKLISRLFQKWCSSGVVSAFLLHETIDFTDFSGTFQDTAVADK